MRQQYLIPANSKKGQLIFNLFEVTDLVILGCGGFITLMLALLLPSGSLGLSFLKLLPLGLAVLLVFPVAFYHNVRVFLQEAILYFIGQKQYHWKGWCAGYVDEQQHK